MLGVMTSGVTQGVKVLPAKLGFGNQCTLHSTVTHGVAFGRC